MDRHHSRQLSIVERIEHKKYALETMGDDSGNCCFHLVLHYYVDESIPTLSFPFYTVYQFFLGKSWTGWFIVMGTIVSMVHDMCCDQIFVMHCSHIYMLGVYLYCHFSTGGTDWVSESGI